MQFVVSILIELNVSVLITSNMRSAVFVRIHVLVT